MKTEKVILDSRLYSGEAVRLASRVFLGRAKVKILETGKKTKFLFKGPPEARGDFMNEVLNQQCRLDLAGKNSRVAQIIVTKTLLSALRRE